MGNCAIVFTLLVIILILVANSLQALVVGLVGRWKGRRFWFWALLGFVLPLAALIVVLFLPRRR